jgi:uncharacterized protein (DUF1778 family)
MKRSAKAAIPEPSLEDIKAALPKSETIHLRVTTTEKEAVRTTATSLHLSITEYLLKCHAVVAAKIVRD